MSKKQLEELDNKTKKVISEKENIIQGVTLIKLINLS